MNLGIDRFRGHEHQRAVLGLAHYQVLLGDIADVLHHVGAQPLRRDFPFVIGACIVQRGHRFERKFGIDAERARVGQKHHAIGPLARRKRMLKRVRALRHPVLDDGFHPRLPERAARLLVGEHIAQRRDLRSQIGEVLVRIIDNAEPLVQHPQTVHGVAGGLLHRLADAMGDRVEPLADGAGHLRLPARQCLPHRIDAAGGLALRAEHFAQPLFKLFSAGRLGRRKLRAAPA